MRNKTMTLFCLVLCLVFVVSSLVGLTPSQAIVNCPNRECSEAIATCNSCGLFLPVQQEPCVDSNGNTRTRVLFHCCYPYSPLGACTKD